MMPQIARLTSISGGLEDDQRTARTNTTSKDSEPPRHRLVRPRSIAFVGTYPPRRCGIATFTRDLLNATQAASPSTQPTCVAVTDPAGHYQYPVEVRQQIRQCAQGDYPRVAEVLNDSGAELVSIQHEYGIYGGADGAFVLDLLSALRVPAIATLHTVLRRPSDSQKRIIHQMARHCAKVVVMSKVASELLVSAYGISASQIRIIPHGIPEMGDRDQATLKTKLGIPGRPMMLSFGLLGPNKGIEVAIRALPALRERFPELVYYVVGATHPEIVRQHGEAYRESLVAEAERLGVRDQVVFHDHFVSNPELFDFLKATDIFVTPYQNEAQVTSGALSYAMGAGASVVSTPFWHAQELLADGRGRLFPFGDHRALGEVLRSLLESQAERARCRASALELTRSMVWPRIGESYLDLGNEVIDGATTRRHPVARMRPLPTLKLDHLRRLTDDTGIIQHASYSVPSRKTGYCVDDNARALIVALKADRLGADPRARELVTTYLAYLQYAQDTSGEFCNFLSFDRTRAPSGVSDDCTGRAIWSLGTTAALAQDEGCRTLAQAMLDQALDSQRQLGLRGTAFSILGLTATLRANPVQETARGRLRKMTTELVDRYLAETKADWRWFEPTMTYDNGVLPLALFSAFSITGDMAALQVACEGLQHLDSACFDGDTLSLVGNAGWFERGGKKAIWDEQPVDAAALVMAFRAAYSATGEDRYLVRLHQAFDWFVGANRLGISLYDPITGGCRDGLGERAANQNQGAESTLSWLLALFEVMDLEAPTRPTPLSSKVGAE